MGTGQHLLIGRLIYLIFMGMMVLFPAAAAAETADRFTIDLQIQNRKVVLDTDTIKVTQGQKITLKWETDEKVDLHLHGYDVSITALPGKIMIMDFMASTAGRFPVTAHNFGHGTLIYIEIYPD